MRTLLFSLALLSVSGAAHAQMMQPQQQAQPSFDQYPSFIEMSTSAQGIQSVLRCGYTAVAGQISADPGYYELTTLNQGSGMYLRIQHIDGKTIATTVGGNQGRFVLQVGGPNGATIAKECLNDPATDSLQGCVPAQPFMAPQDLYGQDQNVAGQCSNFLSKATAQLDPNTYNLQKTQLFKANLRQKAALLEGQ